MPRTKYYRSVSNATHGKNMSPKTRARRVRRNTVYIATLNNRVRDVRQGTETDTARLRVLRLADLTGMPTGVGRAGLEPATNGL